MLILRGFELFKLADNAIVDNVRLQRLGFSSMSLYVKMAKFKVFWANFDFKVKWDFGEIKVKKMA